MITKDYTGAALSALYDDAVKADSRDFIAGLYLNGSEIDCSIKSFEIIKGSCGNTEEFTVGNLISSTLTAELTDLNANLKNEEIELRVGLYTDHYEYITMGFFTITDVKRTIYSKTITGYGRIASKTSGSFTAPATKTLARIAQQIGIEAGCTVILDSDIDSSIRITEPLTGLTTYEALQILTSVVGGYAIDTYDGNIKICKFKDVPTAEADIGLMLTLPEVEEQDFEVTGVRCIVTEESTDDEGEDIPAVGYETGTVNLEMKNKYMTAALFNDLDLIGYTYRPGDIDLSLGDPRLEGDDVLEIDGYIIPCHVVSHRYDGGLITRISSVRATNQENKTSTQTPFQRIISGISSGVVAARKIATTAKQIAGNTAQYFWFKSTGSDTGAHITEIPREDFEADPQNGGGNLLARSNGIAIRDGLEELATFAAGNARIGRADASHADIEDYELSMSDENDTKYFRVGDLRKSGTIVSYFSGDGSDKTFDLGAEIDSISQVRVNNSIYSQGLYSFSGSILTFNTAPADEATIRVMWRAAEVVPYMQHGTPSGTIGPGSVNLGDQTTASGQFSHAEGSRTEASGAYSHAEGSRVKSGGSYYKGTASGYASHAEGGGSTASGKWSHAEGVLTEASGKGSHAEGYGTKASGTYAHAEGYNAKASGGNSAAFGLATEAQRNNQVVFGFANIPDTSSLMIVGNGVVTDGEATTKRNALQLDTNGNLKIAGTLTQASDKRLKEHIKYLSDDAVEFIRKLKPALYKKDEETHVGLYAQDVAEADTWECMTGEMNGYMTLAYTDLIAPLISYCQALEKRIEDLEHENN